MSRIFGNVSLKKIEDTRKVQKKLKTSGNSRQIIKASNTSVNKINRKKVVKAQNYWKKSIKIPKHLENGRNKIITSQKCNKKLLTSETTRKISQMEKKNCYTRKCF